IDSHHGWVRDINETQNTEVNYPIIADEDKKVSVLYDMIHPNASENVTVRSVFIISPDKKIKLTLTYPASTVSNLPALPRVIGPRQLTATGSVARRADGGYGEEVVSAPAITNEDFPGKCPKRHTEVKPGLRPPPPPHI